MNAYYSNRNSWSRLRIMPVSARRTGPELPGPRPGPLPGRSSTCRGAGLSGRSGGRRGTDWVPEGSAVGGRGEADLGREVLAQPGRVPEPGLLGDLLDGELRGLQEASGEE